MRNLKKFLALVLAMVMAMSLMVTANAATKGDWNYFAKEEITEKFREAVDVLAGLKVFQGQNVSGTEGGETKFNAKATITRAETAALIYRIATGDVSDERASLYKHYARFSDVREDAWYAGYVGYDSNAEIIKGSTDGNFYPGYDVTGFQVLAMILRTIGYDQNGEFTGYGWEVRVASTADALGILDNLNETRYNGTLSQPANREVVAELLFQTLTKVPRVQWTEALGYYNQKDQLNGGNYNPTQGQYIFGLNAKRESKQDEWGRPTRSYLWTQGGRLTTIYTSVPLGNGWLYKDPNGHPTYTVTDKVVVKYDRSPEPTKTYTTTVLECDVAHDLGIEIAWNFDLYVNGDYDLKDANGITPVDSDYRIQATDTTTKVGGQGRLTEFYVGDYSDLTGNADSKGICVMIDTMLARVTNVTEAKLDRNNHVIIPAQMEVTIYDGPNKTNVVGGSATSSSNRTISKPSNSAENWEYSKGEFILLNAYTDKTARVSSSQRESAAFETDKVVTGSQMNNSVVNDQNLTIEKGVWINKENLKNGVAEHFKGKQTVVSSNTGKHTVDGTPYDDQLCLFLDRAGTAVNTSFEWYLDQYGNLIGIGDAKSTNFGVITGIYAALDQGQSNTTGGVKAVATVKYADGTTGPVTIDRFAMSYDGNEINAPGNNYPAAAGCDTVASVALQGGNNTIDLRPVYDTMNNAPLSVGVANPPFQPVNSTNARWLYLAVSTSTNSNAHFANAGGLPDTWDSFGILYNHMFEFVTASDNSVVAVEVAGVNNVKDASNTGIYEGNANAIVPDGVQGKLFKNTAFLTLDNTTSAPNAVGNVYLNDDTKIMVRVGNRLNSTTINTYDGVSSLPGDITIPANTEVDWADTDGDGRADYVYINCSEIPSIIDYALFYFNQGAAQWNGSTGIGTVEGYLNGQEQTVTFVNQSQYWTVVNSTNDYLGHLFALQLTNGVVSNVMVKEEATFNPASDRYTPYLLKQFDNTNTPNTWNNTTGAVINDFDDNPGIVGNIGLSGNFDSKFQVGVPANPNATNPYSETTAAVYYYDTDNRAAGTTDLRYERESGGYKVIAYNDLGVKLTEYWIAPNATIEGELEWLNTRVNYVTMVYESNNANAIMEIYITPVPDVTPSGSITAPVAQSVQAGPNVSFPVSLAALEAGIISGARDTVLWSGTNKSTNAALAIGAAVPAKALIYFPFTLAATNAPTLEIRDAATGDLVYSETLAAVAVDDLGIGAGDAHCFVIDYQDAAGNAGYAPGLPMRSGYSYNFRIISTIGGLNTVLSTGSFTMGI